ncbi:hypothetical protein Halha_2064 [Halobacteroides halobius DSM 5150]|uniref:Baseplate protein J-like barrel domain-containing protein n=1 Tax=Halobacteroides halobius (strain ATCC 35273 / DSM 5150 / MD-1) TaxID=748449 RepID=L0KD02_HALHC|nr:baseplate J/gp47 family protein [Halobacteroides halobius]AGB41958.1 hypothetical protein Halha_2064 [Halobacteroides halobius DSM 5150]
MQDYNKIYIDPDEPLSSLLERIKSDPKDKIVIIIHHKSPIFSGQINIELIKSHAQKEEKELIFITDIEKIKNLLVEVGFLVYSSLEEFEVQTGSQIEVAATQEQAAIVAVEDQPSNNSRSKSSVFGKLALIFILIIVAAGVWFYFTIPLITIDLVPVLEKKPISIQVKGLKRLENINYQSKMIPLIKKQVKLKEQIKVKATGHKEIGVSKATGFLALINDQRRKITIPQGTKVATRNGVQFRTLEEVTVPSAKVNKFMEMVVGVKAGRAEVNIEAIHKGEVGNVSKARIVQFVNNSYPVKIINPESTTGGENSIVKVITHQDIKRGLKKAKSVLLKKARQRISNLFPATVICFKDDIQFSETILNHKLKVGDIAKQLAITGSIKATSFAVKKEGLTALVFKSYKESLRDDFKLKSPEITIQRLELTQISPQEIKLNIKARGQIIGKIDKKEIIERIIGKRVKIAKEILNNKPELSTYQIKPANQVNLPQFRFAFNVVIKEPVKE